MGQIRNVTLIVIATAVMAIATSILVYFADYLILHVRESTARFTFELQQKYVPLINLKTWVSDNPNEKNNIIKKEVYNLQ
jgi:hypothetical protein